MTPITAAFTLFLLAAAALIGARAVGRGTRLEIERRVNLVARPIAGIADDTVRDRLTALWKTFDAEARAIFSVGTAHSWGMRSGALRLASVATASAVAVFFLVRHTAGLSGWLAALLTAATAFLVPRALLLMEQRQAERQFVDYFPDAVDTAVRMLRAGLPITSSLQFIGTTATAPVSTIFARIADRAEIGVPTDEALDQSSQEIGLPDFRFFAVAVMLQRATGGNLASTLEVLSDIIRKRRAVRLKSKSATAEIRISAYILVALPFLVAGTLLVVQPDYMTPLYLDPRGHIILGMAAGSLLFGLFVIRQMMRRASKI